METATATMSVRNPPQIREFDDVAKNKRPVGRPASPDGPTKSIGTRPSKQVRDALTAYIADQELDVKAAQVLSAALEEFLEKRGYLKPEDNK